MRECSAAPARLENVASWPREVRQAVDAIACVLMATLLLVRSRAAAHASRVVRWVARRDRCAWEGALLKRELALLRRRASRPPERPNPHPRR